MEQMTRQFENDMQPDGAPYTVLANNLMDHNIFIQGLRNAGFEIHNEHISIVPSAPETAIVTFASDVHARQAMLALHLREFEGMEGKRMYLMKAPPQRGGWDDRSPCAPLPTHAVILQAMGEAYFERVVAPKWAEQAAAELRKTEKRMGLEEEARLAQEKKQAEKVADIKKEEEDRTRLEKARQAKQAKKAANIKKAEEAKQKAKLAKEARRARHMKLLEEHKLRKEAKTKEAKITAQQDEDLPDGFEGMEDIKGVAEKEPEVSAWLEVIRLQHRDREDLGTALEG